MAKKNIRPIIHSESREIKEITHFLQNEYKEYAKYVIANRALPSIVDGFKTGARKIMHAALNGGMKSGKEVKNLNLVGDVYNLTLYQHGDASLHGTIFTLSQFFKDNLNPLSINGQCGTLRDTTAIAAPRYLHVRHSKFMKLYKTDSDLLEFVFDEGQYLEPVNYLPIIPTVLTARTKGMAPGYAFESFSYNPLDIIDACIDALITGKVQRQVRPYVRGIRSENFEWNRDISRWVNYGSYTTDEKADILYVTDLPYDVEFDTFEKRLNKLVDSGYIRDWSNHSEGDNINYWVFFPKTRLSRELKSDRIEKLYKQLMLKTIVPANTLCVLDENGRVRNFHDENSLIEYFVKFRLGKYTDRKERMVKVITERLEFNSALCKFIELVNNGIIKILKRKKSDIKLDLDKHKLPHEVLGIPISRLTDEEKAELLKKNEELKKELEYIKSTTTAQMYFNDLVALHIDLEPEFENATSI